MAAGELVGARDSGARVLPPIQRLHVAIWYILRAQRCSHITTLGPKYIPYSYMEPLGYSSVGCSAGMQSPCMEPRAETRGIPKP